MEKSVSLHHLGQQRIYKTLWLFLTRVMSKNKGQVKSMYQMQRHSPRWTGSSKSRASPRLQSTSKWSESSRSNPPQKIEINSSDKKLIRKYSDNLILVPKMTESKKTISLTKRSSNFPRKPPMPTQKTGLSARAKVHCSKHTERPFKWTRSEL